MITLTGHHDGPPAPGTATGGGQPASAPAKPVPDGAFATFLAAPMKEGAQTAKAAATEAEPEETVSLTGVDPAGTTTVNASERRAGAAGKGMEATAETGVAPPPKDTTESPVAVALAGVEGVLPPSPVAPGQASATARSSPQLGTDTLQDAPPMDAIARGDAVSARPLESAQGQSGGTAGAAGVLAARPPAIAREVALPSVSGPQSMPLTVAPIVAQSGDGPASTTAVPVAAVPIPVMAALHAAAPLAAAPRHRIVAAASGAGVLPSALTSPIVPALRAAPPAVDLSAALAAAMSNAADPAGLTESPHGFNELRASTALLSLSVPASISATAGPDIPRQIALQIAHAAEAGGGVRGTIELSLSPEELGRVRLRLHPSEAGLSVTITADRPETLDLMRRNIDLLAREFVQIGYEGTQFDFTQGGQGTGQDHALPLDAAAPARAAASPDITPLAPGALLVLGDRLDIRL